MMDIKNKETRKELIYKYLNAETTLLEERLLADYYLGNNNVDEDERAIAETISVENIHVSVLSHSGVEEFDKIVNGVKQKSKTDILRLIIYTMAVAASIALLVMIYPFTSETSDTVEIAQCIRQVMNLRTDDIISVTATPIDDYVWINAELNNGDTKTFIMSSDKDMGTTSLLAIN